MIFTKNLNTAEFERPIDHLMKSKGACCYETQVPVNKILALTDKKPVFGHRSGKRSGTHWITFIK